MLDTHLCIEIIKKKPEWLIKQVQENVSNGLTISALTLANLEYGVELSKYPERNSAALIQFLAILDVLPYDDLAAHETGIISADMEKLGISFKLMDICIAGHAKSADLVLATTDNKNYDHIPGLKLEKWTKY